MTTYITNEFIESVRGYIYDKAYTLFKKNQNQKPQTQLFSMETWDPIFDELKNQIRFYSDISLQRQIQKTTIDTIIPIVYPSETFDDYIARISDLQRLGPYDYTEFYKKMKDPEFVKNIKKTYEKLEQMKKIKQEIILYVFTMTGYIKNQIQIQIQKIECINLIPLYEYISKNNMNLDEEPIYKNFRSNKQQFYEIYTLWDMKNIYIK